ncbi:bacterial extracellular solute-binding s, 3 family protein [Collimonas arenae]|uniref:Bacterial extracellular solute-binding s, 3 family protein n=1 Tax=Collimonas arenae TaxID=279058 RepID=A0A127PVI4_9BURK|nr:transporter substrate-binding domain-containing protein [Collimonas arenae]AMP01615.1 bacterial extracellular solute-binding s, 3 family protein [Collimonas arenae]AMP11511.1 bacterial extracellular solute-binding s, 3 family protein [Collimonas arenae]
MKRYTGIFACVLVYSIALAGTLLPAAESRADSLDDIQSRRAVRVAVPKDTPPFGSENPYKTLEGFDISIAKMVSLELGVKLDMVPLASSERIPQLLNHHVDLVISSLGKNPERLKQIDFSQAYAPFYLGIFGAPNLDVKSAAGLAGKTIAVLKGSIEETELTKVAPPTTIIKHFDTSQDVVKSYLSGESKLLAAGNVLIAAFTEKQVEVTQLKIVLKDSPCFIGVNKNEPALLAKVNTMLTHIKQNGVLNINAQRWFKAPLPDSVLLHVE